MNTSIIMISILRKNEYCEPVIIITTNLRVIKLNSAAEAKRPGGTFDGKLNLIIDVPLGGVQVEVWPEHCHYQLKLFAQCR